MKKFVLIDSIGTWEAHAGGKLVDCTVKRHELVAEADSREELYCPTSIEYRQDGTWHHYTVEPRARARKILI